MNRKSILGMAIVFFISLFIQLVIIFNITDIPLEGDSIRYDKIALNVAAGKGFTDDDGLSPSPAPGYIKHGYVLFLALVYKIFGHSIFLVKIIQALFIASTCIVAYRIGKELFGSRIGYYSALITAIHPGIFVISSHVISESTFMFLLALTILYLVLAMKRKSLKLYMLSGIFLAISTQVRFTSIFLPFFILAGLLIFYKEKLYAFKVGGLIFLIVTVMIIPWAIRNYIHFGHINPFADHGGALWLGSYTERKGENESPVVKRALFDSIISLYLEKHYPIGRINPRIEVEWQKLLLKSAFDNIKKDPLGYIALFPKKILRLWVGSYSGLYDINISFSDFMHNRGLIIKYPFILLWKFFVLLFSWIIFLFGIIGMIISFKRWKETIPLYLVIIYFTLLHMITFADTRLGIPALPYMIIFVSTVLLKIFERSKFCSNL